MKKIELEQGSQEWLSWRKTVITATDCAAVRGSSPWTTAYKAWQKKLGYIPEEESNEAMERGKRLEPIIRGRFIEKSGINMTPMVVESSEYSFLGASLDGISDCGKYLIEVKTGGKKLNDLAKQGIIPTYYQDQMQQQLLVTRAEKTFYVVGDENGENDITIEFYPDPKFEKEYIPVAREFWKYVALEQPPALQEDDYRDMCEDSDWNRFAVAYKSICEQIKELEETKEDYRKSLLRLCRDQNCMGQGIRALKIPMRGRVAYDEIPEVKAMTESDLDKFRKKTTTTWKILVA